MLTIKWLHSLHELSAAQWDALFTADPTTAAYPFCRHAFLLALEQGGSVNAASGWHSRHLTLWQQDTLVAAVPGYLKRHSYGEYLFDWQIAEAYQQHNLVYYPKWIAAIPFTPAAGPRLGVLPALLIEPALFDTVLTLICDTLKHALSSKQFHSVQWLYTDNALHEKLLQHSFLARHDVQFLWHNNTFEGFDDYLSQLNSRKRKQIRHERSAADAYKLVTLSGNELSAEHWQSIIRCYQATYLKRSGHQGYISTQSFITLAKTMADNIVVFAAFADDSGDNMIAAALCFKSTDTLYGRYWGTLIDAEHLHFELCYYQGIEYCIKHGLRYFDAGAQGEHKLKRGFAPVLRYGSYLFADTPLSGAITAYFKQETEHLNAYSAAAEQALPYKKT